jgi:hypothetical protein
MGSRLHTLAHLLHKIIVSCKEVRRLRNWKAKKEEAIKKIKKTRW